MVDQETTQPQTTPSKPVAATPSTVSQPAKDNYLVANPDGGVTAVQATSLEDAISQTSKEQKT